MSSISNAEEAEVERFYEDLHTYELLQKLELSREVCSERQTDSKQHSIKNVWKN